MSAAQREALDAARALRNREGYYVSDYETTANKIGLVGQIVGARIRNLAQPFQDAIEMAAQAWGDDGEAESQRTALADLLAIADALAGVGQPPVVTRDAESPPTTERSQT